MKRHECLFRYVRRYPSGTWRGRFWHQNDPSIARSYTICNIIYNLATATGTRHENTGNARTRGGCRRGQDHMAPRGPSVGRARHAPHDAADIIGDQQRPGAVKRQPYRAAMHMRLVRCQEPGQRINRRS